MALNQLGWLSASWINPSSLGTNSDKKEKVLGAGRWPLLALVSIGWIEIFLEAIAINFGLPRSATRRWSTLWVLEDVIVCGEDEFVCADWWSKNEVTRYLRIESYRYSGETRLVNVVLWSVGDKSKRQAWSKECKEWELYVLVSCAPWELVVMKFVKTRKSALFLGLLEPEVKKKFKMEKEGFDVETTKIKLVKLDLTDAKRKTLLDLLRHL